MTDQEAREFVQMLAVPQSTDPPPCPLCGRNHQLEAGCVLSSREGQVFHLETFVDEPASALEAAGLRE